MAHNRKPRMSWHPVPESNPSPKKTRRVPPKGWLSKLWSLFGYPKYEGPYYHRDPKRDHNFDNNSKRSKKLWTMDQPWSCSPL